MPQNKHVCLHCIGQGSHIIQEEEYPISKGDIVLLSANVAFEHYAEEGFPLKVYNCLFLPHFIDQSLEGCTDFVEGVFYYESYFINKTVKETLSKSE